LAGETGLTLYLRKNDGTLLNTGGDAFSDLGSAGVFTATLAESRVGLGTLHARVCDGTETADNSVFEEFLPESETVIGATGVAVLNSAYLFDDGAGRLAIKANVTHYQGTLQGNGDLPAKMDSVQSSVNSVQTDVDAANNYLSAIAARIGAFTGSGVNTILGFFKSLLSKTASLPSDVGGTFDPAADSTEALRDRGDAAWTTGSGGGGGDNTEVLDAIDSMKSLIAEWIALNIPSDVRGFPATIIGGTDIEVSIEVVDSNNDPITEIFGESVESVQWLFGMGTSARRARILGSVEWTSDDLLVITIAKADTLSEDDGPRTWMIGCKLTSGEVKWVKTGVTRLIGRQFAEPTTTTTGA
jgi:hypothetical protein